MVLFCFIRMAKQSNSRLVLVLSMSISFVFFMIVGVTGRARSVVKIERHFCVTGQLSVQLIYEKWNLLGKNGGAMGSSKYAYFKPG